MKKYKLINRITKEEYICTKVTTINGFDYYLGEEVLISMENLKIGEIYIEHTQVNPERYSLFKRDFDVESIENSWKVIATNNPNIDIPNVIDEVMVLAEKDNPVLIDDNWDKNKQYRDEWIKGYNKHKETNPFTEEDVKWFFSKTLEISPKGESHTKLISDDVYRGQVMNELYTYIFKLWEEQKIETIYFN